MKKIILALIISSLYFSGISQLKPAEADSFYNFILANKNKAAVFITEGDKTICKLNEDKLMPLASTVKIIIAIEFAKQAGSHVIDENSTIDLAELDKYYIPNTDGDAHPNWIKYETEKNNILNNKVKLIDVARGMMMFSSNANAEFLMDLLGFDNVKNNTLLYGLPSHTTIFPLVASLFMYQNPMQLDEKKVLKSIKNLSEEKYCRFIAKMHAQLSVDSNYKKHFRPQDLSPNMQKLWSDRLPASTVKEYAHLAKILNNRKFMDEQAYGVLAEVLEYNMEKPGFAKTFKHFGSKGGSTAYVLTHVVYLTKKDDSKMEMAIFFNDLNPLDQQKLQSWLDPFEAQIIFDPSFRNMLKF